MRKEYFLACDVERRADLRQATVPRATAAPSVARLSPTPVWALTVLLPPKGRLYRKTAGIHVYTLSAERGIVQMLQYGLISDRVEPDVGGHLDLGEYN